MRKQLNIGQPATVSLLIMLVLSVFLMVSPALAQEGKKGEKETPVVVKPSQKTVEQLKKALKVDQWGAKDVKKNEAAFLKLDHSKESLLKWHDVPVETYEKSRR